MQFGSTDFFRLIFGQGLKFGGSGPGVRVRFDGGTAGRVLVTGLRDPATGDESDVPGWDAFDPPHWSRPKLWGES